MTCFFLNGIKGETPLSTDYYDPKSPYFGNSNLRIKWDANGGKCLPSDQNDFVMVDWLYMGTATVDLRQMLVKCVDGKYIP